MIRRSVLETLGYFDCVRVSADSEYLARIERYHGARSLVQIEEPLALGLLHPGSLTQSSRFWVALWGMSPNRRLYIRRYREWHQRARSSELHMPFPPQGRKFSVPQVLVERERVDRSREMDTALNRSTLR